MTSDLATRPRLVFGASGYIGTNLVPRLLAAGVPTRVSSRQPRVLEARGWKGAFNMRKGRIDYAYYAKRAGASAVARASTTAVWSVAASIGGENRYFYLNALWTLRETLDWALGGPGLQRGRRHPTELRVGDRIDSWEVIGLEPERRLTLSFGMRAPGAGVLELEIETLPEARTRVTATAYWHPGGVWGLMYWLSMEPAHLVIFRGLTQEIARRAEARERGTSSSMTRSGVLR